MRAVTETVGGRKQSCAYVAEAGFEAMRTPRTPASQWERGRMEGGGQGEGGLVGAGGGVIIPYLSC